MNQLRFKRRSDLQNFARKYPGALAAHLLIQIRERMGSGMTERSRDLYRADPTAWAAKDGGLKDPRDVKEFAWLTQLLLLLNQRRMERVADLLAMRIRELRFAKSAGNSWEKAEVLSLVPNSLPSTAPVPDAGMAL